MSFEPKKIFVGGLAHTTNTDSLKSHFEGFGEVADVFMSKNAETGTARGFAFVTFTDDSTVEKLLTACPHIIDGKTVDAKRATVRGPRGAPGGSARGGGNGSFENAMGGQGYARHHAQNVGLGGPGAQKKPPSEKQVFVGGVPNGTTKEDLQQFFTQFGPVESANLMVDRETGRNRGFGFVNFSFMETVEKVLGIKHFEINGKAVEVKKAERRVGKAAGQGPPYMGGGYGQNAGMMDPSQHQWQAQGSHDQYQYAGAYGGADPFAGQYNGQYAQQQGYNPQVQYGQQPYPTANQQAPQQQYGAAATQGYAYGAAQTHANPASAAQPTANQLVSNPSDVYAQQPAQAAANAVQQQQYGYQQGYSAAGAGVAAGGQDASAYAAAGAAAATAPGSYGQVPAGPAAAAAAAAAGQYGQAAQMGSQYPAAGQGTGAAAAADPSTQAAYANHWSTAANSAGYSAAGYAPQ